MSLGLLLPAFAPFWDSLLDLVYPVRCAGCDRIGEGYFCAHCRESIPPIESPFCARCHEPGEIEVCPGCRAHPPAFACARAVGVFQGRLRQAIHAFKYGRRERLAPELAELLARAWERESELHDAEAILPLPIHRQRERDRGFNQSLLLARALAQRLDLPLLPATLVRPLYRRAQVGLGAAERRENVSGVFQVNEPTGIAGKKLLLIDDVLTTGATCNEAARTLLDAGASQVQVLVLAREPFRRDAA